MLQLDAISKTYGSRDPVFALRDCNLAVAPGESVGIHGRSGSGKSTLLNIIGLLEEPDEGNYYFETTPAWEMPSRYRNRLRADRIGFVFQAFNLSSSRTALENVVAGLRYQHRIPRRRWSRQARSVLERVGVAHRAGATANTLSGGEQQRVAIARAIASEPDLLLCDEPTGNLDSDTGREIIGLLQELHAGGTTLIVVSHDLELVNAAQRTYRMQDGQLLTSSPAK